MGEKTVMSLDGRVVTQNQCVDILGAPAAARDKMAEVVQYQVMGDNTKKGTIKKTTCSIPPVNTTARPRRAREGKQR